MIFINCFYNDSFDVYLGVLLNVLFQDSTHTIVAFMGVANAHGASLQPTVTSPKARYKRTLLETSEMDL